MSGFVRGQIGKAALTAGCVAAAIAFGLAPVRSTPITTREGVLPPGTELNEEVLNQPTERFSFEAAGGKRSYLSISATCCSPRPRSWAAWRVRPA
jgi:hypothetical protein